MNLDIIKKAFSNLSGDELNEVIDFFSKTNAVLGTIFDNKDRVSNLAQITPDMGDIIAGRFISPDSESTSNEPTSTGFSGTFMSANGEVFSNGVTAQIGGVASGVFQWGASPDGSLNITAEEFNNAISPLRWIKDTTGEVVGFVFGSYVDGFGAGTFLVGQGNSADTHGVAQLQTLIQGQQINEFATRFYTYSSGGATLESGEDATNDAKGSQGLTIKTKISADDNGEEDSILYLQSRNKGITKAGWGNKIVFQLDDRSGNTDDAAYLQIEAIETEAGAESYRAILGVKQRGSHVETVLYETNSYTRVLLHFNGADGSTTFTDEKGTHTWVANGNVQIDTSQSVFGGASALFDGTGDFISSNDHADWQLDDGSNSNSWSIQFRVRFNGDPSGTAVGLCGQHQNQNNWWALSIQADNTLRFTVVSGGVTIINISNSWNPADATWYAVEIIKDGTNGYMMFVDGAQIGTTQTNTNTIPNFTGPMRIGVYTNTANTNFFLNGWIDEFRLSKGIARHTTNFTPDTVEF